MKTSFIVACVLMAGLAGVPATAGTEAATPADASKLTHIASGTVKSIDTRTRTVTVAHEPVASMGWPAMTMQFAYQEPVNPGQLSAGRAVMFNFVERGSDYVITAVQSAPAGRVASQVAMSGGNHGMMAHGKGDHMMDMDMCGGGMMRSTILSVVRELIGGRR